MLQKGRLAEIHSEGNADRNDAEVKKSGAAREMDKVRDRRNCQVMGGGAGEGGRGGGVVIRAMVRKGRWGTSGEGVEHTVDTVLLLDPWQWFHKEGKIVPTASFVDNQWFLPSLTELTP